MPRLALVLDPTVTTTGLLEQLVVDQSRRQGWEPPVIIGTSGEEPGTFAARDALASGARLVVVAGDDRTVGAVAEGIAGSGVPLAIVPTPAGSLLAQALGLPFDPAEAVAVAFDGSDRAVDLGRLDDGHGSFAVRAILGTDAITEGHGQHFEVELSLDDAPALRRRAVGVLVTTTTEDRPTAPPHASPEALFDVCVFASRHRGGLTGTVARLLTRRPRGDDARIERWQAHRVLIRAAERRPRRLDGQEVTPSTALDASIVAAAVIVRVPGVPAGPGGPDGSGDVREIDVRDPAFSGRGGPLLSPDTQPTRTPEGILEG